ncbi:DUF1217 domain-containing protein [Falsihalocynthiibacter sp. S25ZX9]|uniref:DUF1217 domain-containing protein n=1 Tax=Falsihalocynthiibacter sp. S25ZX9 TaxID=3240870 RepID=UPI0035101E0E
MTFQALIPLSGYAGWTFLTRTRESQQEVHDNSPLISREVEYFKENISKISTAKELVKDRTLLKVALGAFGLDADLPNKAFVEKVLVEGSLLEDAFAHRLSDKRYLEMTVAFGFDLGTPRSKLSDFGDKIVKAYKGRQFEVAVGQANDSMRLALTVQRDLTDIANDDMTSNSKWFTVMGNPPLRSVFDTVFNLPSSFGALDLDRQLEVFQDRAERLFGSSDLTQFSDPEKQEDLIQQFLVRSQLNSINIGVQSGRAALSLLQNSRSYFSNSQQFF